MPFAPLRLAASASAPAPAAAAVPVSAAPAPAPAAAVPAVPAAVPVAAVPAAAATAAAATGAAPESEPQISMGRSWSTLIGLSVEVGGKIPRCTDLRAHSRQAVINKQIDSVNQLTCLSWLM